MSILNNAIKMEIEGEEYYRKLAERNKDNPPHGVFQKLADDEKEHAHVLKQKEEHRECTIKKSQTFQKASSVFQSLEEFKSDIREIPSQIDSYRFALEKEKESIDLYTDLKEKSESSDDKEIFDFLIEQEKDHYNTINNLIDLLTQAEDWVESAEFGIRPKY
ncbi:MAG: ferritin family protein [Candidatus Cloacimonetes bacterium]|nr:ferritin family protein [Candidatus Cloacimonadota bacterium]